MRPGALKNEETAEESYQIIMWLHIQRDYRRDATTLIAATFGLRHGPRGHRLGIMHTPLLHMPGRLGRLPPFELGG